MLSHKLVTRFIVIFFLSILAPTFIYADSLIIASGRGAPFVTADKSGFFDLIVKEMFSRINIEAATVLLPSERSLINANTGINDGNIARIKGLEKTYKNLIRVPEKIINYEFVAFTENKNIQVKNWQGLKDFNIAFITGWKIFEKNATQYKSLVKIQNATQLFELLNKDRVDLVLYERWSGVWWSKQFTHPLYFTDPPIVSKNMYLYLHKKHTHLISKLVKSLKSMKKDGAYQRIFQQTLN